MKTMAKFVKEKVPENTIIKRRVKGKDRYFVVSETMVEGMTDVKVFPSNENGKISDMLPICGGRDISVKTAINILNAIPDDELLTYYNDSDKEPEVSVDDNS